MLPHRDRTFPISIMDSPARPAGFGKRFYSSRGRLCIMQARCVSGDGALRFQSFRNDVWRAP